MRITEKTLQKRLTTGLQNAKGRLAASQERVAKQKNIRRPSDDPIGLMKVMSYHRELYKIKQTVRNAENVSTELFQMDIALQIVGDILLEAKTKATIMSSDTVEADDRLAVLAEVELMIGDVLQKANTTFTGKYIFGGYRIFTQPYVQQTTLEDNGWTVAVTGGVPAANLDYSLPPDAAAADVTINIYDSGGDLVRTDNVGQQTGGAQTYIWDGLDDSTNPAPDGNYVYKVDVDYGGIEYIGDDGEISQKIELNGSMVANVPGLDIFGTLDNGVFKTMADLKDALQQNDPVAIQATVDRLNADLNRITSVRGEIGVKIKRVDASVNELKLMEPMLTDNLSQIEDVDMVMESTRFIASQEAYQTALQTTGSTLNLPSLLDFIR